MTRFTRDPLYRRHRFPAEVIAHAVWLYFRFPLSLRMVEDMLAARGVIVSHQTVRLWAEKFGRHLANAIRKRSAGRLGDKWHLDEVVITIGGKKHWLWRAVDQDGFVLDVLVQSRRNAKAAKCLMRKLLKGQGRSPRVMITDKPRHSIQPPSSTASSSHASMAPNRAPPPSMNQSLTPRSCFHGVKFTVPVDVFPKEPASNNERFETPLQGLSNVILTPHIGGSTESLRRSCCRHLVQRFGHVRTTVNCPKFLNQRLVEFSGHLGRPTLWKPITTHVLPPDENVHRASRSSSA